MTKQMIITATITRAQAKLQRLEDQITTIQLKQSGLRRLIKKMEAKDRS